MKAIDFLYDSQQRMLQPVSPRARYYAKKLGEPLSVPGLRLRGFYVFEESIHNFDGRNRRIQATEGV
jgi:hypothetical protein